MLPSQPSDYFLTCFCGQPLIPFDWMCLCTYNNGKNCTLLYDHQIRYNSDVNNTIDLHHTNNQQLMINMDVQAPQEKGFVVHTLHCKKCKGKVATVIKTNVKQLSDGFVCFRREATYVKGLEKQQETKWPDRNLPFSMNYEDIKSYIPQSLLEPPQKTIVESISIVQTVLPSLLDENRLEKYHPPLLYQSTPRDYQLEMYFQSLFKNSLICLPTGLGKTLVSFLLMKKMYDLNPNKLVAFVVNKIPLAFQQSEYYNTETGDESLVLCSETRTAESIERLRKREVQVCFFTDGLLWNLFEDETLRPEDFSMVVFDEIHNGMSSNSNFNLLGAAFLKSQAGIKIAGLTASPIDFQQLEKSFKIDSVSYPSLHRDQIEESNGATKTKINFLSLKTEQENMLSILREEIILLNDKLEEYKIDNLDHYGSFVSIIGNLRFIKHANEHTQYIDIAKKMLKLIGLMNITSIMGTKEAMEDIKSIDILEYLIPIRFKNVQIPESYSKRLDYLKLILDNAKSDSRILVFVQTKETTFKLKRFLESTYPHFNPRNIVGQRGIGGMDYENEQKKVIEEFKNNKCKLLVSTSVLEEGIDISDCNLVVLFDGDLSLRRIIQSRGRARQKDSEFHLIIEQNKQKYEKIEMEEKVMIELVSLKADANSINIKPLLENYLEYRKTIEQLLKPKLLSFTIHHSENIASDDIRKTMQSFKRKFRLMDWDKQCAYVEMTLAATKFESIRKEVFNKLLDNHTALFIEPTESLHTYHSDIFQFTPGALTLSDEKGFEYLKSESTNLQTRTEYHDKLLRAVGKYVLVDERNCKYIVNIRNSELLNKYSLIGTIEPETISIPNTFKDEFKVYFIKLNEKGSQDEITFPENSSISYYLSYIQDRNPMVNITPNIISSINERLKSLMKDDSFSSSALIMSLFTVEISSLLKKCTFTTESKVLDFIEKLKVSQLPTDSENKLIRSVTFSERITHGLPQLLDGKRFFRKLHPDDFIKVKIIGELFPSSITCCGKKYLPLGGSLSMLRSDYVFFFDSSKYKTVDELMKIFGTYDSKLNPFKLISRHALNFTTTKETCDIEKWEYVDDEPKAADDSIMTDGIGKISLSIAKQISDKLGLVSVPTAFQVRVLGFKGVLTVLPDEDVHTKYNKDKFLDIVLRESMLKFDGNKEFNKIEVVSHSNTRRPAYLNKQIILLLKSLGITNETFLSIFLEYFKGLAEKIRSPKYFLQLLKENCMDTLPAIQSLNEMPDNEFLQYLAKYLVYESIKKVQTKAMIPIEKSVIAISVVDEYQLLQENEVMVLLGDENYLEDGTKVFICRNPCMHPSDIQVFTCRNNKTLKQKYRPHNAAIIFPTQGKTSIKLCDFDGDRVFVCWDPRLVPGHVSNLPLNSDDNGPMEIVSNHLEALSKILENGKMLSKISDGWVALADAEDAYSDRALELADLFVNAVDFPKNGKTISLPEWFTDIVYPDFMERGSSIKSNSILGRIYQKCINIKSKIPEDYEEPHTNIEHEQINEWNRRFWQIVEYLKQVHSCTLFDLIVGNGVERKEFTHLIEQFREIAREENCKLALEKLPISNIFSLTIPSRKITEFTELDIKKNLAKSLARYVEHMNIEQLEIMEQKLENLKNKTNHIIHMYGSLPLLLHSMSSDCDVFINFKAEKGDKNSPPVCSILLSEFGPNYDHHWNESVPLFKLTTDLPFTESIDFTNSNRGLRKKHHLRRYITQKPTLVILLKVLIDVLRKICPQIKTYQFIWSIIEFCVEKHFLVQENPPTEKEAFAGESEKDSVFMKQIIGKCLNTELKQETDMIVNFLDCLQFKESLKFKDNLDDKVTTATLTTEEVINSIDLLDSCLLDLYLLQDFTKLGIEEKEEQFKLPSFLKKVMGTKMIENVKFELEKICNCKITKIIKMNNGDYLFNASGEHGIGSKLKKQLALWNANCKCFRANSHRSFLEGSTYTIFQGDPLNSPIELTEYSGKRHPKHMIETITTHQPELKIYMENSSLPLYDFNQNLCSQIQKMARIDQDPNHFAYSIKFGRYYLINIEKSTMSEITIKNSQHYNFLMKKNHFHSVADVIKTKEKENKITESSKTKPKENRNTNQKEEKIEAKAPSDSFFTIVNNESISAILKIVENCPKQELLEYHVFVIENNNNSIEYKLILDENLKLKSDGILDHKTRVMATTFIGKSSDMRFYINYSTFLPEDNETCKRLYSLNKDWIIRINSPNQLTFNDELPLVNVVRKVEKQIYTYEYNNQLLEITILKVSLFTKKQSSSDKTLYLSSPEHYELKIALPKTGELSCLALLSCGIHFWKIIQNQPIK